MAGIGSISRPALGRAAATGLRRKRTSTPPCLGFRIRPQADLRDLARGEADRFSGQKSGASILAPPRGSVPARQADHKRDTAHEYQAQGPSRIQIEPAPRHELETEIAVDQPRQESAGGNHRDRMDAGDQDGHVEIGIDESARRLVAAVAAGGMAEAEINRYQHQSRAMRGRHGKGPKRQLCRSYPRQHPRMASVDEPEDAEPD